MYLYGASGHGKVVKEILDDSGVEVTAFIDDNPDLSEFWGLPVLHNADGLDEPIIVCIGKCDARREVAERLKCKFATAIHSSAVVSPSAKIGEGTVVMQGAVVQADVLIGNHCIVNTKASVDHECVIEDFVHIAPGSTISGNVHIGSGTWIGVGTTVIQGVKIGKNCFIGAGSVIVKDVPDNSKGYGVPFKVTDTLK